MYKSKTLSSPKREEHGLGGVNSHDATAALSERNGDSSSPCADVQYFHARPKTGGAHQSINRMWQ
jgi:hypothetical protein